MHNILYFKHGKKIHSSGIFFFLATLTHILPAIISKVLTNSLNQNPMLQNSRAESWQGNYNSQAKAVNQYHTKTETTLTYFPSIDFMA